MTTEHTQQSNGTPWYGELPADRTDLRDWVGNKGFQTPVAALESYFNAEKLLGAPADQIIKLPKAEDKAAWDGVWNRLGRPEKPEGYELPLPANDNGEFSKTVANWFHQAGVPKAAAQAIAKNWNDHIAKLVTDGEAAEKAESERAAAAVRQEWGSEAPKREEMARRAFRQVFGEDKIEAYEKALGTAEFLKMAALVGDKIGEPSFAGDRGPGAFSGSPAQARAQLDEAKLKRINNQMSEADYMKLQEQLGPVAAKAS